MMSKDNKADMSEFTALLRRGIGTRAQNAFCRAAGITPPYLSRLLNGKLGGAMPKVSTLKKISKVTYSISLNDFLKSLGMQELTPQERVADDAFQLKEFLQDAEKNYRGTVFGNDISKFEKELSDNIPVPGSLFVGERGFVKGMPGIEIYVLMQFRIYDRDYIGAITFLSLFKNRKKPEFVRFEQDMNKITQIISRPVFTNPDTLFVENAAIFFTKDGDGIFKTIKKSIGLSAEERLLQAIFGEKIDDAADDGEYMGARLVTVVGFGFKYNEGGTSPDQFRDFLFSHAGTFCRTKEEITLYRKLIDTDESPNDIFEGYIGNSECAGTGAVVAEILSREYSGKLPGKFKYYETPHKYDNDEPGYICICPNGEGNDYSDSDITPKEIIPVYTAAKELGISRFGACYTFREIPEKKKTFRYYTDTYHFEF